MGALDRHARGAVPGTLSRHFHFTVDGRLGDSDHYHLYCYYVNGDAARSRGKFHTDWHVSGTDRAMAADEKALADDRRAVNEELFVRQIVEELRRDNACLVEQGDALIKMPATPDQP